MILVFLIVLIVALVLANIFVALAKPKRSERGFANPSVEQIDDSRLEPLLNAMAEKMSRTEGMAVAANHKLNSLNERVSALEKTVSIIAEKKIEQNKK